MRRAQLRAGTDGAANVGVLQNGSVGGTTFGAPGYATDQCGIVHLFGHPCNASSSTAPLSILAAGIRPAYGIDELACPFNDCS